MNSSEFVRQELRAVVSGRNQQTGGRPSQSPLGGITAGGGGTGTGNGSNNTSNSAAGMAQGTTMQLGGQSQQMSGASLLNTPTDPSMGFNFDMTQTGKFLL